MPLLGGQRYSGQAEFLAILGLVIIGIVIVVLTIQPGVLVSPPPASVAGTQSEVKAAIESYIRSSASDSIRILGEQGGYAQLPADTVEFLGKPRPYWERSGTLTGPDASQQLTALLASTLNANKAALAASFPETSFGDARVTATVRDTAVDVTVAMPTTVKGYSIAQPYSVSVPSKYGALVRSEEHR